MMIARIKTEMFQTPRQLLRCVAFAIVILSSVLPASAQQGILAGDLTLIELGIGKGQLVRLQNPASTVYLADPSVADIQIMSPQLIYLFGQRTGETNLYAVSPENVVVADMTLVVGIGVASINRNIRESSPDSTLSVGSTGDVVIIEGDAESAEDIADAEELARALLPAGGSVVNQAHVTGSQQVNLQVRFAEVSRSAVRNIGINWEAIASSGNFFMNFATGNFIDQTGRGFGDPVIISGNRALIGGYQSNNLSVNTLIDALVTENLVYILAEPNLTALSGETASFLAGGEFPIATTDGNGGTTIQFQSFGVSLAFTPTVLDDGRISLNVAPEVSELTNTGAILLNGFSVPGLSTRRVETTVELGSGQSFVIAGMFKSTSRDAESLTPFLSDLPVLGPMFRRRDYTNEDTELVIVVTPFLVQPVSSDRIAMPTDRLVAPLDQVPEAQLAGPGSTSVLAGSPIAGAVGSAGFILK